MSAQGLASAPQGAFAITVGAGRRQPKGRRLVLGERPSVGALADALRGVSPERDGWWAPHGWRGDYREAGRWEFSAALVADVDFFDAAGRHNQVPRDRLAKLEAALDFLPASLYHPTPRGARLAQVLTEPETDAARYEALGVAYGRRVQRVLGLAGLAAAPRRTEEGRPKTFHVDGFRVDPSVSSDRARFLFAPNAIVGGIARSAEIVICSEEPADAATILAWGDVDASEEVDWPW